MTPYLILTKKYTGLIGAFRVAQKEKMEILNKIIISQVVIFAAPAIGKRLPSAAVFKMNHFQCYQS